MNATTKTAAQPAIDNAIKFSVLSYYKYHFVKFLKEMDKLDEYQRQLEALDRREALTKSLMEQLDKVSAEHLAKDFQFERECMEQNIADTEYYLESKSEKLIAAAEKMAELGLPVEESVITMAKVYINA